MKVLHILRRYLLPSARALRVGCFSTVVFAGLALAAARSVHADAREIAFAVGHELASLEDFTGDAYQLHLNGAEIHRASLRTSLPMKDVLDRYQAYCAMSPSAIGRALQDIPQALEERVELPKGDPLRQGIVREEDARRGMIACFVDDGARPGGLRERLRAFHETRDLAEFGRFRAVFVERMSHGENRVVTIWADGALDIGRMFPAEGDAPGTDSTLAPRLAGSRRTFSASADGYPAAVRIYEIPAPRDSVLRRYDEFYAAHGYTKVGGSDALAYVAPDGQEVFLSLGEREGRTTATVVETGQGSIARIRMETSQP